MRLATSATVLTSFAFLTIDVLAIALHGGQLYNGLDGNAHPRLVKCEQIDEKDVGGSTPQNYHCILGDKIRCGSLMGKNLNETDDLRFACAPEHTCCDIEIETFRREWPKIALWEDQWLSTKTEQDSLIENLVSDKAQTQTAHKGRRTEAMAERETKKWFERKMKQPEVVLELREKQQEVKKKLRAETGAQLAELSIDVDKIELCDTQETEYEPRICRLSCGGTDGAFKMGVCGSGAQCCKMTLNQYIEMKTVEKSISDKAEKARKEKLATEAAEAEAKAIKEAEEAKQSEIRRVEGSRGRRQVIKAAAVGHVPALLAAQRKSKKVKTTDDEEQRERDASLLAALSSDLEKLDICELSYTPRRNASDTTTARICGQSCEDLDGTWREGICSSGQVCCRLTLSKYLERRLKTVVDKEADQQREIKLKAMTKIMDATRAEVKAEIPTLVAAMKEKEEELKAGVAAENSALLAALSLDVDKIELCDTGETDSYQPRMCRPSCGGAGSGVYGTGSGCSGDQLCCKLTLNEFIGSQFAAAKKEQEQEEERIKKKELTYRQEVERRERAERQVKCAHEWTQSYCNDTKSCTERGLCCNQMQSDENFMGKLYDVNEKLVESDWWKNAVSEIIAEFPNLSFNKVWPIENYNLLKDKGMLPTAAQKCMRSEYLSKAGKDLFARKTSYYSSHRISVGRYCEPNATNHLKKKMVMYMICPSILYRRHFIISSGNHSMGKAGMQSASGNMDTAKFEALRAFEMLRNILKEGADIENEISFFGGVPWSYLAKTVTPEAKDGDAGLKVPAEPPKFDNIVDNIIKPKDGDAGSNVPPNDGIVYVKCEDDQKVDLSTCPAA